jgi:hypothetical protein
MADKKTVKMNDIMVGWRGEPYKCTKLAYTVSEGEMLPVITLSAAMLLKNLV